jgi:outer membrane protein OmpA-like peptidoglycan-associated protein
MKLRNALLAATVMAAPVAAMAQPVTGPYVSLGAGFNYMQNNKVSVPGVIGKPTLKDNGGPVGVFAGGYGLGNGLRVEIEGDYRYDHTHIGHNSAVGGGSNIQNYGVMGNVLYDFSTFGLPVVPYVGVGGGFQWSSLDATHLYTATSSAGFGTKTFGDPAVQAIIGAAYPIPTVPGLALTAEYRFMTIFSGGDQVHGYGAKPNSFKLGNQYDHAGLIGIRYNFGVAPPPPPPAPVPVAAPAPAPARTYLVFFDWDKYNLTPRARQIIAEAATASTHVAVTKIDVSGYTDTSGTAAYNQVLSRKRADTVAAELVRLGVPKASIAIFAFGETHPLVPTGPGVREPQNRRVEIVLK